VNSTAPAGTGDVNVGVLKTGVVAKVVAKGLGDGSAIDVFGGPPSAAGGLTAVLTLRNVVDGSERRFCTRFAQNDGSTVVYEELASGGPKDRRQGRRTRALPLRRRRSR
jgi:hypothetical protein